MDLVRGTHRRYNPLLQEWVLCSPERVDRPWQGQLEEPESLDRPSYDPGCYLCPGNARAGGARNPSYASTFVFDNDFPALQPAPVASSDDDRGLLLARPETGCCRVVCFSPRHDQSLGRMAVDEIRAVVDCWAEETARLAASNRVAYVQVFENKGAAMGCSNPHPHGQVWATANVPSLPARSLSSQRGYCAEHGSDLLGDYLERELREAERVVCENQHWVALVPFWAVWPFEALVLPRRRVADLPSLSSDERTALADILKRLNTRYDNLFGCPFPYSMGWRPCPTDGQEHAYCRLHALYYPPLLRSARIRKFLVGYEMIGEAQRDITPEDAAERLRRAAERHDGDGS
ncbi:MAG TPA: UDP-glucose--hexose-1-phosphate uridylyltransferase [Vicinamibacteria bacterium]|nr:UDP-glucose--hexose-1-phosphate uridylyltransferase [Vicinamibacteria bacterium]